MLMAMEDYAKEIGIKEINVMSTFTASEFYKHNGFIEIPSNEIDCISMIKIINS